MHCLSGKISCEHAVGAGEHTLNPQTPDGVKCVMKLVAYSGETLLKVAKNFLRFEMPLSVFWRDTQRKRRKCFAGEQLLFCTDAPFSTTAPHCCCYDALL